MNRLRLASLLFAAAAAVGAPAAGAPRVSEPGMGARLAAGTRAVALFDLGGAALDGVDEMELVLSLDGGRTFPHCVSRDLPPGSSRAVWTAPDLPSSRAVLGVRTGGRGREERVVAVSAPFEIVAPEREAPNPNGGALAPRDPAVGPSSGAAADLETIPLPSPDPGAPSAAAPPASTGPDPESRPSAPRGPLFLPRRE
jgi:hypothetical protein